MWWFARESFVFINADPLQRLTVRTTRLYTLLDNRTDAKGTWKVSGSRRGDRYLAVSFRRGELVLVAKQRRRATATQVERETVPRFLVAQPSRLWWCVRSDYSGGEYALRVKCAMRASVRVPRCFWRSMWLWGPNQLIPSNVVWQEYKSES